MQFLRTDPHMVFFSHIWGSLMTDSTRPSSHMTGGTGEASAGVGWPGLAPQKIGIWITKELQFIWSQRTSIANTLDVYLGHSFWCVFIWVWQKLELTWINPNKIWTHQTDPNWNLNEFNMMQATNKRDIIGIAVGKMRRLINGKQVCHVPVSKMGGHRSTDILVCFFFFCSRLWWVWVRVNIKTMIFWQVLEISPERHGLQIGFPSNIIIYI
jgi:hypothetical protein